MQEYAQLCICAYEAQARPTEERALSYFNMMPLRRTPPSKLRLFTFIVSRGQELCRNTASDVLLTLICRR